MLLYWHFLRTLGVAMKKHDTKTEVLGYANHQINNLKQTNLCERDEKSNYKYSKDKLIKPNL